MSRLEHTDEESTLYYDSGVTHRSPSAINNRNTETEKVLLLDISSNKEWMASVTRNVRNANTTYLTVRRLIAVNADNRDDKITIEDGKQATATEDVPLSIDISSLISSLDQNHCKFLSISRDGKYIALSFYYSPGAIKNRENIECFLFEVLPKSVSRLTSVKLNGRAVFLNDEKDSLLFVDAESIRYSDFLNHPYKNIVFDLDILIPGVEASPTLHDSYIKSHPWLDLPGKTSDEVKKIIIFTRHIRQNILITPFDAIRIWSLSKKCILRSSISAKGQHIMAFSKSDNDAADNEIENNTLTAAYSEIDGVVNVYNVKHGLLVYDLKIQGGNFKSNFKISHMYFCFENRYLAISGIEDNDVVFEVWYLDSKKRIHEARRNMGESYDELVLLKVFEPFIIQKRNLNGEDSLTGFYMSRNDDQLEINFLDLDIDTNNGSPIINWKNPTNTILSCSSEIDNSLLEFQNLKCGNIKIGEKEYLIRFGMHTIQLWKLNPDAKSGDPIRTNDELIYIRAYKGPDYGLNYSFRKTWVICEGDPIELTGGKISHRLKVNTMTKGDDDNNKTDDSKETPKYSHTEQIFLMPGEANNGRILDSHRFESACQALHYLYNAKGYKNKDNMDQLRSKTQGLITSALRGIGPKSTYFTNITGNKTLAMLASFEEGRKIIAKIITTPVPISICSYPRTSLEIKKINPKKVKEAIHYWKDSRMGKNFRKKETVPSTNSPESTDNYLRSRRKKHRYQKMKDGTDTIARNENVLTVLIDNWSYYLFKLLFNRVLSDSKILGVGSLCAIMDVIVFLQEADSGLLDSELNAYRESYAFHYKDVVNFSNMEPHTIREELKSYTQAEWRLLKRKKDSSIVSRFTFTQPVRHIANYFIWNYLTGNSKGGSTTSLKVCIIPLQNFNLYNNSVSSIIGDEKQSSFIQMALNRRSNTIFKQGDTIFEVSLEYKWKTFARTRFILICFIHALYYISYSTGVLFSRSLYATETENEFDMQHPGHITSLAIMGVSFSILVIQEIRQFFITPYKMHYILSGYNWVDIAAFIFPAITVLQSLLGWDHFSEVSSFTALILWSHGILRLRVISHFGITLEIIIQLFKRVFSTLCIIFLAVVAFTMSFIVLLAPETDSFFQENYLGDFTSNASLTGKVDFADVSADNGFTNWFKAFSRVWLFIFGVWDPITQGKAGDSKMLMAMCILYSCIIILIFFNLIIALMASAVEEVRKRGRKAWVGHFAAVVSEIELLWCSKAEQNDRENNPSYIYYVAKEETILKQEEELEEETKELYKKLNIKPKIPTRIRF
ncbi:hypothetical protein BDF21DRAFT_398982 [Thamnidium elegans]|nr:hypothetical protein BDF21DRAFT_398982 [Thamnidium elegans]